MTTLQYQASKRDICLFQETKFLIHCYQHQLFPSAFKKYINKCISLCFILYLLTSYVFCLFLFLYFLKNNQKTTLCHPMYDRLVVWFLAKSEGLVFPLPYPEAGGQVWHFCHSRWRPNPRSQFCTQGWGSGVDHFSSQKASPNHCLSA